MTGAMTGNDKPVSEVAMNPSLPRISNTRAPFLQMTEVPVSVWNGTLWLFRFGARRDVHHLWGIWSLLLVDLCALVLRDRFTLTWRGRIPKLKPAAESHWFASPLHPPQSRLES